MIAVRGGVDHVQLCPRNASIQARLSGASGPVGLATSNGQRQRIDGEDFEGRARPAVRDNCRLPGKGKIICDCRVFVYKYHKSEHLGDAFGSTRRGVPRCQGSGFSRAGSSRFKFAVLREAVTAPTQLYRHDLTRHLDSSGLI